MRSVLLLAVLFGMLDASAAHGQTTASAERFSVGVVAEPALELGADLWFMSAVRVSGPVAGRVAFDLEAAHVEGASNPGFQLHRQFRARVRIDHQSGNAQYRRYWIAGVSALPADKRIRATGIFERRVYTSLTFGYGAEAAVGPRVRVWNEAGVDGGDAIRGFVTVGVKYRF